MNHAGAEHDVLDGPIAWTDDRPHQPWREDSTESRPQHRQLPPEVTALTSDHPQPHQVLAQTSAVRRPHPCPVQPHEEVSGEQEVARRWSDFYCEIGIDDGVENEKE